jgi:hypothetical protein
MMKTDKEYVDAIVAKWPDAKLVKVTKLTSLTDISRESEVHDNYWVVGVLDPDCVKVGSHLEMLRFANSSYPTGKWGNFNTSEIISIEGDEFTTRNSRYKIEKLN